jgi:hypothetical protein
MISSSCYKAGVPTAVCGVALIDVNTSIRADAARPQVINLIFVPTEVCIDDAPASKEMSLHAHSWMM